MSHSISLINSAFSSPALSSSNLTGNAERFVDKPNRLQDGPMNTVKFACEVVGCTAPPLAAVEVESEVVRWVLIGL